MMLTYDGSSSVVFPLTLGETADKFISENVIVLITLWREEFVHAFLGTFIPIWEQKSSPHKDNNLF